MKTSWCIIILILVLAIRIVGEIFIVNCAYERGLRDGEGRLMQKIVRYYALTSKA